MVVRTMLHLHQEFLLLQGELRKNIGFEHVLNAHKEIILRQSISQSVDMIVAVRAIWSLKDPLIDFRNLCRESS